MKYTYIIQKISVLLLGIIILIVVPIQANAELDWPGILDKAWATNPRERHSINQQIQQIEQNTWYQVAVLIEQSLQGRDDGEYGLEVFNSWWIGDAELNTWLLLLISIEDKVYRSVTGVWAEEILTTEVLDSISERTLVWAFRAEDYAGGIVAYLWAVEREILNPWSYTSKWSVSTSFMIWYILIGFLPFALFIWIIILGIRFMRQSGQRNNIHQLWSDQYQQTTTSPMNNTQYSWWNNTGLETDWWQVWNQTWNVGWIASDHDKLVVATKLMQQLNPHYQLNSLWTKRGWRYLLPYSTLFISDNPQIGTTEHMTDSWIVYSGNFSSFQEKKQFLETHMTEKERAWYEIERTKGWSKLSFILMIFVIFFWIAVYSSSENPQIVWITVVSLLAGLATIPAFIHMNIRNKYPFWRESVAAYKNNFPHNWDLWMTLHGARNMDMSNFSLRSLRFDQRGNMIGNATHMGSRNRSSYRSNSRRPSSFGGGRSRWGGSRGKW